MKALFFSIMSLSILTALPGLAQDSIKPEAVTPEHFAKADRQRPFPRTGKIVERYLQEKIAAGEINPAEYQQLVAQRDSLREEIKTLRQAGDREAVQEKMLALREQRQQQRDYVRTLIDDDPQLRQRLIDSRHRLRWRQLQRRHDLIERRMERLRDRRRSDRTN